MSNDSVFLLQKIECPVCKSINEFEVIKIGSYTEDGRDSDFCPTSIEWRTPRYQGYNPLLFFTGTCGNCFYSREVSQKYREWKNDVNFKTYRLKPLRERHLEQFSHPDSIVKLMGQAVDSSAHPNESAILKLLLAVYDEELLDLPNQLDLGRYYLRVGWVYRYMSSSEDPGKLFISGLMNEVTNKHAALHTSLETFAKDISSFARHVSTHFDAPNLSADLKSRMLAHQDSFESRVAAMNSMVRSGQENLDLLKTVIDDYRSDVCGGEADGSGVQFAGFSSFSDFMLEAKRRWSGLAINEHEALKLAAKHYQKAFTSGKNISVGNQQLQVSYLIAELSRRVGDHDIAKQYFNSTIKAGQEFIYQNRTDKSRTELARKIMELAIEQGRANLKAAKPA